MSVVPGECGAGRVWCSVGVVQGEFSAGWCRASVVQMNDSVKSVVPGECHAGCAWSKARVVQGMVQNEVQGVCGAV